MLLLYIFIEIGTDHRYILLILFNYISWYNLLWKLLCIMIGHACLIFVWCVESYLIRLYRYGGRVGLLSNRDSQLDINGCILSVLNPNTDEYVNLFMINSKPLFSSVDPKMIYIYIYASAVIV